jgi:N-formylglutamate amidohydrolase
MLRRLWTSAPSQLWNRLILRVRDTLGLEILVDDHSILVHGQLVAERLDELEDRVEGLRARLGEFDVRGIPQ